MMDGQERKRIVEAEDRVLERVDYIPETIPAPDFVECVGRTGGSIITLRICNDGGMCER